MRGPLSESAAAAARGVLATLCYSPIDKSRMHTHTLSTHYILAVCAAHSSKKHRSPVDQGHTNAHKGPVGGASPLPFCGATRCTKSLSPTIFQITSQSLAPQSHIKRPLRSLSVGDAKSKNTAGWLTRRLQIAGTLQRDWKLRYERDVRVFLLGFLQGKFLAFGIAAEIYERQLKSDGNMGNCNWFGCVLEISEVLCWVIT